MLFPRRSRLSLLSKIDLRPRTGVAKTYALLVPFTLAALPLASYAGKVNAQRGLSAPVILPVPPAARRAPTTPAIPAQSAHQARLAQIQAAHNAHLAARQTAHQAHLRQQEAHRQARLAKLQARHQARQAKIQARQAAARQRAAQRLAKLQAQHRALTSGNVVEAAYALRGTRYVMGGVSRSGFDCSGFVRYILGVTGGVSIPRTAVEQFYNGAPIAPQDMQPGDLVFFKNTYKRGISHVGIYAGGGKFIHAANPHKGVRMDNLGDKYYAAHFAGARRVLPEQMRAAAFLPASSAAQTLTPRP